MFRCNEGHVTKEYEDTFLVVTQIREVEYTHIITNSKKETFTVEGKGFEVVKEVPLCLEHMESSPEARLLGKVSRTQRILIPEYKRIQEE